MSDLISREGILEYLKTVTVTEGITFETGFKQILHDIETQPSVDILEHARAIKEYCERFPECEGCRFYNGLPFRCAFGMCPQEWHLPEGEKEPPIFTDSAPLNDCKNTAESYGEICVKCNKCGRFGEEKE